MSAICGSVAPYQERSAGERDLASMLDALRHRGPDDAGTHSLSFPVSVFLGFRFLRTAPDEVNPGVVFNEDESLAMVCDGHAFNSAALRNRLEGKGHRFSTSHSCEVLLHLYEEEGIDSWRQVDGQFALAIWNSRNRKLVLGRDPLGVRPLYYSATADGIVFASEIRALLRSSRVPAAVDETAVSDFLTFTSVPGPRTLFRNIRKLPPGMAAEYGPTGESVLRRYWDLLQDPVPASDNEQFYVQRVRSLHEQAVSRRAVSGPIGSLLSGGNDSSANAALLARFGAHPLHTFTVGLADLEGNDKYNDLEYARKVAQVIKSDHHERLLTTDEFIKAIPVTIEAMDDLVAEPSSVFLYHALQLARDQGLRVVVTGEANDELCCGHGGMIHIRDGYYRRWQPYMARPAWLRRLAAATLPVVSPKHRDVLRRAADGQEYFWSYETAWMDSDKAAIATEKLKGPSGGSHRIVLECKSRFEASAHHERDYLQYIIYAMMQDFYFTNLMLGKLDLLASSLGIEPRCPYTEPEYAHFVYNIPSRFKANGGLVKYFFKKAIEGLLPHEIIYRPKQGFRTPVVELFQGALGTWAAPILLETGLTQRGYLRREHLEQLLQRHRAGGADYANRLWTVMSLNLWHDTWITSNSGRQDRGAIVDHRQHVAAS